MVNVQKHCWNLHNSTFILFIGHLQVTCVRKSLSYWHAKSWDCFLTQWLPIKRILLLNKDNLTIPIQMQLSQKQKLFSEFFATFLKSTINFKYFEKRIWSLSILYFPNYGLRKRGEINVLKIPVSEDPSRSNMVNVPKHCSNLHHSTLIIFIGHCQGNWVGKILSYWHAKSWDCSLTHWLPMKSILFFIGTIQGYEFRWNFLKNKKVFLIFLVPFWNLD